MKLVSAIKFTGKGRNVSGVKAAVVAAAAGEKGKKGKVKQVGFEEEVQEVGTVKSKVCLLPIHHSLIAITSDS